MMNTLTLDDIRVDVVFKDIKNVHLSVHPPTGRVTISAPLHMGIETVRAFAASKIGWIRRQQVQISSQERETPREYIDRESHYLWGRRYLLKVEEVDAPPSIEHDHSKLVLRVPVNTDRESRDAMFSRWYRNRVRAEAEKLIAEWQSIIGARPDRLIVRRMKTMWGSCTIATKTIRLNTELAKKPRECLEYIIVHEMVHLHEPTHNARFVRIMDSCLPDWRTRRDRLNELPVRHEEWSY